MIGQEVIFTNEKEITSSCTVHHSTDLIMFEIILASVLQAHSFQDPEYVNKMCSYLVGIPYASDNFNDEEWERFKVCREVLNG